MMQLHCLGTAGYHPNARRHTACYAVPSTGIVLDAGSGLFRLPQIWNQPTLDIFLTHAHLDHIIGLTFLLNIEHQIPLQQIRIFGEQQKLQAIQKHLFNEMIFPVTPNVLWRPLAYGEEIGISEDGRLTCFPLEHPGGSVGYRIDWPEHRLAYVTDTTAAIDAPYIPYIRNCDLLVHECYFRDHNADWARKTGHSWTTAVAEVAVAAKAKNLLLVHIDPLEPGDDPVDLAIARHYHPNTMIAEDEMVVDF